MLCVFSAFKVYDKLREKSERSRRDLRKKRIDQNFLFLYFFLKKGEFMSTPAQLRISLESLTGTHAHICVQSDSHAHVCVQSDSSDVINDIISLIDSIGETHEEQKQMQKLEKQNRQLNTTHISSPSTEISARSVLMHTYVPKYSLFK
jgi:hypothetical protein